METVTATPKIVVGNQCAGMSGPAALLQDHKRGDQARHCNEDVTQGAVNDGTSDLVASCRRP